MQFDPGPPPRPGAPADPPPSPRRARNPPAAHPPPTGPRRHRWLALSRCAASLAGWPAGFTTRRLGHGVGKPHVPELDLPAHARERRRIGRILHRHRLLQHPEDPFGTSPGRLPDVVLFGPVLDRP